MPDEFTWVGCLSSSIAARTLSLYVVFGLLRARWLRVVFALFVLAPIPFMIGCEVTGLYPCRIVGESMTPTLFPDDRVFANQAFYAHHPMKDGDVVIFRHHGSVLVKRISALPGETIEGRDGTLFRNGQALQEPYLAPSTDSESSVLATFASRTVPKGQIFVTGDHRDLSSDSRSEDYGPVYVTDIIGKLIYVYGSSHGNAGRSF